jgi:hypothetical protein
VKVEKIKNNAKINVDKNIQQKSKIRYLKTVFALPC